MDASILAARAEGFAQHLGLQQIVASDDECFESQSRRASWHGMLWEQSDMRPPEHACPRWPFDGHLWHGM